MSSRNKKNRRHQRSGLATVSQPEQPQALGWGGNYQGAQWSTDRGWIQWNSIDPREEITSYERGELLRRIHFFKAHFGFARGLINNSADLIGWHIPQAASGDAEWDAAAEQAFEFGCGEEAAFDVAGKFDVVSAQPMIMRAAFTDAHIFTVMTKWDNGAARFAFYEASQLRNPKSADKQWRDGIKVSKSGRHLAYGFHDPDSGTVVEVPAASVIYFGEFDSPRQDAPVPKLAHAVNNCADILEIWGFQKKTVKSNAASTAIIEQDLGATPSAGKMGLMGTRTTTTNTDTGAKTTSEVVFDGGQIARLSPGEKAKILADPRPSAEQRQLILDLKRDIAYGWGLPLEVVDAISELTGPGIRFVLDVAGNWIECRRERQKKWLRKVWRYTIACEIAAGRLGLPKAKDGKKAKLWNVNFTGRRLLTIDRGKESQARLNEIEAGVGTWKGWEPLDGQPWQDRMTQRITEVRAAMAECGIDPTPEQLYAAAFPPRAGSAAAAQPAPEESTPPPDKKPAAA